MNKFGYRLLAAAAAFSIASAAHSATIVNPNGTVTITPGAGSFQVDYNGFVNTPAGVVPGLTSSIQFNFLGTSAFNGLLGASYDFSYTLTNTSSAPITASRASIFGFNVDPDVSSAVSGGLFPDAVFSGGPFNVPNAGPNVELCFKDANQNNCTGGSNGGVTLGNSAGGTFSLRFDNAPVGPTTLSNFYIRYQSIVGPGFTPSNDSASGLGTPIPEPATWGLMIAGFALVGGALRRRRSAPRFVTA